MTDCPTCEYHKQRAQLWRDEAYRLAGHPLPERDPVEWGVDWGKAGDIPCVSIIKRLPDGGIEVVAVEYAPYSYTAPPQRTWVGLTDREIETLAGNSLDVRIFKTIAQAIEAKLKEKNT